MGNYKIFAMFLLFFFGISQATSKNDAEKTINKARNEYLSETSPLRSDRDSAWEYIDREYEKTPLPYKDCGEREPRDFKVTNVAMKLHYKFVKKNYFWELYQWDCQFHVVRIDYEITCRNNLSYRGAEYILSPTKMENNFTEYFSNDRGDRMADEAYDWIDGLDPNDYINADGSITWDAKHDKIWPHYTIAKIDTADILDKWAKQKVSIPDYRYMGIPGKLARPVLLIHGLMGDYGQWGVETSENSSEYREGKVKARGYNNGSLPDMLARSNNLDDATDDAINSNGIYFFQAASGSLPHWDKDKSQSKALYEKIKFVMKDFYKDKQDIDWWLSDEYQIDLVGHSQGGLVIREMLRGLRAEPPPEQGTANAANHINRIITVNTPHLGSAFATPHDSLSKIEQEFNGLAKMLGDFDNPIDRTLVKADVDIGFWDKSSRLSRETLDTLLGIDINPVLMYGLLGVVGLGLPVALGIGVALTDVTLTIKGPYIGTYKSEVFIDIPGPWNKTIRNNIKTLAEYVEKFREARSRDYLYKNSPFITRLNNADNFFPKRPDGNWVTMLPMYSDSTNKMIPDLFEDMGEEADRLCAMGDKDPNCFAAGAALKNYAFTGTGYHISKPDFDKGLWDMLVSLQSDWLSKGDAVVEASSQKFYNSKIDYSNLLLDTSYTFLAPRNYAIHDALAPWESVLHGPHGKYDGAPQQGLDLLCVLSPKCDNAFSLAQQGGRNAVLKLSEMLSMGEFSERSLKVAGDFDLAPVYISEGSQAFSISANGETVLSAKYEPGIGSSITMNYNGAGQTVLLLGPEFAAQPSMSRKGDSVFVAFTNYSGKYFEEAYFLPGLPQNITANVITPVGSAMSRVIIGSATATDPETQKPPTPPPGHRLAPVTLAVLHRESRGEYEANTSRPRFLVYNNASDTLAFSKVAYYFTADPARVPNVVVDYPYAPVSVENLGGDKWRFVLNAGNQKIAPKDFYPSADGWQIRVHYSDWYEYDHFDDWSADYSLGMVQLNRKIVIYDNSGKIVWGNEAPGFESEDNGIVPTPKGTIAWTDDAPWETNTFKPRVTVKNTGSIALSDYHAQLWFRIPQGKILSIPSPDAWYTPESQASANNVGGNVWRLDMHFDRHILYSGDSVSEGNIGLHLTDWSNFDKTVCGIALKDNGGNILFGREPSVGECESYNGLELLAPQYSRKQ